MLLNRPACVALDFLLEESFSLLMKKKNMGRKRDTVIGHVG